MSIIEYKHSYLNIIVAVVFVAKIVVDFKFESVIIQSSSNSKNKSYTYVCLNNIFHKPFNIKGLRA